MTGSATPAASGSLVLAMPVALVAGLVSFFSPCVIPLLPGYLSYATGLSGADLRGRRRRGRMLAGSRAVRARLLGRVRRDRRTVGRVRRLAGAPGADSSRWCWASLMILLGLAFAGLRAVAAA